MLSVELNERLTQVGSGTPMGNLLRRYWHPIAGMSELKTHHTLPIRVLGEDLVLYEDRSGTIGLIDRLCAHRRVDMLLGIPEKMGLRCFYHGWMYNETGQCVEMPPESPDSTFPSRVKLKAYPVQHYQGLVFAYLGPDPVPLLPIWGPWMKENALWDIGRAIVPCNWLQIMENSMDPVHTEWNHRYFTNYALERLEELGKRDPNEQWRPRPKVVPHAKIGFDVYRHGIVKRRVMRGGSEDDVSWRIGHPVVFPNSLNAGQIRVPVDDTHTLYIWYSGHDMDPGDEPQAWDDIPVYDVPLPGYDERGLPTWELIDNNSGQDNMAWMSQGPISARESERLGESDKGIILYRRLLLEQMKVVEDGGDPMNTFREPGTNMNLYVPNEQEEGNDNWKGQKERSFERGLSTGSTGKYSVINRRRAEAAGLPVAEEGTQLAGKTS